MYFKYIYIHTWVFGVFQPAGPHQLVLDARTSAFGHVSEHRAVSRRAIFRTRRVQLGHPSKQTSAQTARPVYTRAEGSVRVNKNSWQSQGPPTLAEKHSCSPCDWIGFDLFFTRFFFFFFFFFSLFVRTYAVLSASVTNSCNACIISGCLAAYVRTLISLLFP